MRCFSLSAVLAVAGLAASAGAQTLTTVNINPAPYTAFAGSSSPSNFARLGNGVVFTANDGTNGRELWYSDGTVAGTRMVADIGPTFVFGNPFSTTSFGSRVLFGAWDGTNYFLYSSDGTGPGTAKVLSGSGALVLSTGAPIGVVGGVAYVTAADGQLWRYDGTTLAAVPGTSGQQPTNLTGVGTDLYYAGLVGTTRQGFRLDTTNASASPAAIPSPAGNFLTNPSGFALFNGVVYMQATGSIAGAEPFGYNPATNTSFLVADIVPGSSGSAPSNFTVLGSELVFLANDAAGSNGNLNLYAIGADGVTVTPKTKNSPNVSIGSPAPRQLVRVGNTVYFAAGYPLGNQTQLWAYDGVNNSALAYVLGPVSGGSFPKALVDAGGKLYFGGIPVASVTGTPGPGNELSTVTLDPSGRPTGLALAADIEPGQFRSSTPDNLTYVNGKIFMSALTDANGTELWVYDVPGAVPVQRVCCRGATCSIVLSAGDCTVPSGSGVGTRVLDASVSSCTGQAAAGAGCCYADFDKSGSRSIDDIFIYLNAWFANSPYTQVGGNGTGTRTIDDIFLFLNAWFAGCA